MNNSSFCFCGSAIPFQECCQKYIDGTQKAPTALALMKSRYASYCTHQANYLFNTTHISQRKYYAKADILKWATANELQKLEIITATENTVEFKAYFIDDNRRNQIHHEFSTFKQENGTWFYVDGTYD
ncbi:YchJ family metal-binding protein [Flavobacterium sp.]|uniref:YchJ family protein n=1 Tax=Flavobacterium sp. TaxID=239 RepID=UPI00286E7A1F|nr:YchJ family metal-binding protein [Flavobacterium sp.]